MMETSAQREARTLVEKIYQEYTLAGKIIGTRFESLTSNCLEAISSRSHEKSTHFLFELIQNADDNTYDCPTPTLSFSYKPGSLRVDCNEVGFDAENVEALCAIGRSTRSGNMSRGACFGEKGIGFKSIFKVADIVWLASRDFTFKFDSTKFLGMIAPIWAPFPEKTQPGYTSTYLRLLRAFDEEALIQELLGFDTNLLIFLRRVKEINIRIDCGDGQVWENKLRKHEIQQGTDRVIVLFAGGEETCRYLIRTHVIRDLPKELRRPNWPQTEVSLAFPIAKFSEQPRRTPRSFYPFLPIRDYGLKFLMHGDFLLTVSREDIESNLPWNRTIRDALPEALLQSVEYFNQGHLKYVWPYYLPSASTAAGLFLEPAVSLTMVKLRERNVLESCSGTMEIASSLKHVPMDSFADREGIPFTLNSHTAAGYLSRNYPAWAIEGTISIGVSQLSPREFLQDLNSAIIRDPTNFRTKPASWHSQLADALVKLLADAELMPLIQDMCLILLHDGKWTSAKEHSVFFSNSETSLEIPSGLDVCVVDSIADKDPNRHRLFARLGVKPWEDHEICRLILRVHESSDFESKSLRVGQLISHAAFLYRASWQLPRTANIWFATMQDGRCLGRELYILSTNPTNSPPAGIFAQLQKKFSFIHNDYLTVFSIDPYWPIWLVDNLGLTKVPGLLTSHVELQPKATQASTIYGGRNTNGAFQMANNSTDVLSGQRVLFKPSDVLAFVSDNSLYEDDPDEALSGATFTSVPGNCGDEALKDHQTILTTSAAQEKIQVVNLGNVSGSATSKSFPRTRSSPVLADYRMQMDLLAQFNKESLMIARQGQVQHNPKNTSNRAISTSTQGIRSVSAATKRKRSTSSATKRNGEDRALDGVLLRPMSLEQENGTQLMMGRQEEEHINQHVIPNGSTSNPANGHRVGHILPDAHMELMRLEQQNKEELMRAWRE